MEVPIFPDFVYVSTLGSTLYFKTYYVYKRKVSILTYNIVKINIILHYIHQSDLYLHTNYTFIKNKKMICKN